jgi:large conductance mechanosensitive channel
MARRRVTAALQDAVDDTSGVLRGFKDFVLRGNVIDLAVAVVIGAAFTQVVNALAITLFGSVIAAIGTGPDLASVTIPTGRHDASGHPLDLAVGPFLAATVNFLVVAAVLYFLVVLPTNAFLRRRREGKEPELKATPEDIALLQEIRDLLRDGRLPAERPAPQAPLS